VDIYNVTSGSWTTSTPSIPRSTLAATSSQNLVFFGGGWNVTTTFYDRVDIYNTLNGSWSTATLSQPRTALAATSVGNLVLFGGGSNSNGPSNVVDVFDVTSNTWTNATLSQVRCCLASTSVLIIDMHSLVVDKHMEINHPMLLISQKFLFHLIC
jgi:hypothetical protein